MWKTTAKQAHKVTLRSFAKIDIFKYIGCFVFASFRLSIRFFRLFSAFFAKSALVWVSFWYCFCFSVCLAEFAGAPAPSSLHHPFGLFVCLQTVQIRFVKSDWYGKRWSKESGDGELIECDYMDYIQLTIVHSPKYISETMLVDISTNNILFAHGL